jgi:hypothetical protein
MRCKCDTDEGKMIHNIPQPVFEEFIAERLGRDGVVEVKKNHSFVSCEQVRISPDGCSPGLIPA